MTKTAHDSTLSVAQARELADDLLRALAEHIGDPDAMDAVFRRWLDALDAPQFYIVGLAALRGVFVDCLTVTDPAAWPPHGIALVIEKEES